MISPSHSRRDRGDAGGAGAGQPCEPRDRSWLFGPPDWRGVTSSSLDSSVFGGCDRVSGCWPRVRGRVRSSSVGSVGGPSERAFETAICDSLVGAGGYSAVKVGNAADRDDDFSADLALDTTELFAFIGVTQPEEWEKVRTSHSTPDETRSSRTSARSRCSVSRIGQWSKRSGSPACSTPPAPGSSSRRRRAGGWGSARRRSSGRVMRGCRYRSSRSASCRWASSGARLRRGRCGRSTT